MRARPHSAEETQFLSESVAGRSDVSYASLQRAPAVLLAGFEPQDESPIVFLRLRKAVRAGTQAVYSIAALASRGLAKLDGVLLPTVPGTEASALTALADAARPGDERTAGRARRAGRYRPGPLAPRRARPTVTRCARRRARSASRAPSSWRASGWLRCPVP